MKKSILLAIVAALPVMGQEAAPEQAPASVPAAQVVPAKGREMHKAMLEKYDVDKDGKLSADERETMKKDFEAAMLEKYDADKDGKLSDEEKKAAFEDFRKNHPQGVRGEGRGPRPEGKPGQGPRPEGKPGRGPRPEGKPGCGPRPEGKPGCECPMQGKLLEKYDVDKDGKLSDDEKETMKKDFEAKKQEFEAKMLEKYDVDKDGKLSDDEKETMKKDFAQNRPQGPRHEGKPGQGQRPEGKRGEGHGPRHEGKPGRKGGFRHDKRAAKPEVMPAEAPAPAPEA